MVKKVVQTERSGIVNPPKAGNKQNTSTTVAQKKSSKKVKGRDIPAGGW